MAKKVGPKEAAMKAQREAKAGSALIQLDKVAIAQKRKEAQALADQLFQKEMSKHIKPVEDRIDEVEKRLSALREEENELTTELVGLSRTRSEILGLEHKPKATGSTGGRGAGSRFPSSELPKVAQSVADFIVKSKAEGVSGKDIKAHVAENFKKPNGEAYALAPSIKIVDFIKEHKIDKNIVKVGDKASTRYYNHDHRPD
jgi:hypothetical protein